MLTSRSKVFFSAFLCLISAGAVMSEVKSIVRGNEQFGKNMFRLLTSERSDNIIMSPYSAHAALSMAYVGADGETARAFEQVLGLKDVDTTSNEYNELLTNIQKITNVTFDTANKIFVAEKYGLQSTFSGILRNKFYSDVERVNFADNTNTASKINTWVEDKTNHKIKDLIQPDMLDALTRLVLVNAVYFKGQWEQKFRKEATRKEPFHLLDGTTKDVDMMHITGKFNYAEDDKLKAKILEMPYSGSEMSMLFFLPHDKDGIKHLESALADYDFANYYRSMGKWEVDVSLPRFKIESKIPMKSLLEQMGLSVIFSDKANFSKISENGEDLKVSDVIQKAFIEVNEEGAEAAAATGMIMMTRCMPMPVMRQNFTADRPFVFALVHSDDDNATFMGRVMQPQYA